MRTVEHYFKGLADSTRLRIINLLLSGELCGCDIQYVLQNTQSNVSRHLTYLKNCGWVQDRRAGYRVYYRLVTSKEQAPLFEFLRAAFRKQEPFMDDIKRLKDATKSGACTVSEATAEVVVRRRVKRSVVTRIKGV